MIADNNFLIPEVVIFDVDGTLTAPWSTELLTNRERKLAGMRREGRRLFIASNQGGPAWHVWHAIMKSGRSREYPSLIKVILKIESIRNEINAEAAYLALHPGKGTIAEELFSKMESDPQQVYHFMNDKIIASFKDSWRKPQGDMLKAIIEKLNVDAGQCLYVGNQQTDFDAARAAGVKFADADDFFFGEWMT